MRKRFQFPQAHRYIAFFYCLVLFLFLPKSNAQLGSLFRVVGYYAGDTSSIDSFETDKLTHLIFSFGHLGGNKFYLQNKSDIIVIKKMVALKKRNPNLKVMLSLGGWGGCQTCSDVFNSKSGREEFALSVKDISDWFHIDGIDLDWEYPVIKGFPGHVYRQEDRDNFTSLVKELREVNGDTYEISFAAGGFTSYIDSSIDWKAIVPYVNFINVMSYDLVHGFSTSSGHHTPLYSTPQQTASTDHAVQMLLDHGVPGDKIVIGAAFYGRIFQIEPGNKTDLYTPAHFLRGFSYKDHLIDFSPDNGIEVKWDDVAKAPYAIQREKGWLLTYDDAVSIALKTKYAVNNKLGGIMFWQLMDDSFHNGLLDVIVKSIP